MHAVIAPCDPGGRCMAFSAVSVDSLAGGDAHVDDAPLRCLRLGRVGLCKSQRCGLAVNFLVHRPPIGGAGLQESCAVVLGLCAAAGSKERHDIKAWRLCPCTTPLRLIA